jgi:hypothetical protein
LPARERREELSADQVTAQDKEEIDADPAEAIVPAGRFESEKRGVIDGDDKDSERAEKIETRLALAMRETRIDFGGRRTEVRGRIADKKNPLPNYRERVRQRVRVIS